jgi:hypothetical protein
MNDMYMFHVGASYDEHHIACMIPSRLRCMSTVCVVATAGHGRDSMTVL